MCSCCSSSVWHRYHKQRSDHHWVCLPGSHSWWEVLHLYLHHKVTNILVWISRRGFIWACLVWSLPGLYLSSWGTRQPSAWWWECLPSCCILAQANDCRCVVSAAGDGMRPPSLSCTFLRACLFSFTDLLQGRINSWSRFWKKGIVQVFGFTIGVILSI